MDGDRIQEHLEKWGAVLLVAFAVAWGISYRGLSGETLADAVKDVGAALVPIFAAMFAARLVRRDLPQGQRFLVEGERALRAVQKAHHAVLQGPRYNRDGYDLDGGGKGDRHLFVQCLPKKKRASFVPLSPLSEGVVAVAVAKTHLVILDRAGTSLDDARRAVRKAVEGMLQQKRYIGRFELLDSKNPASAIVIDFDEESMGARRFRSAVEAVVGEAVNALLKLPTGTAAASQPATDEADG